MDYHQRILNQALARDFAGVRTPHRYARGASVRPTAHTGRARGPAPCPLACFVYTSSLLAPAFFPFFSLRVRFDSRVEESLLKHIPFHFIFFGEDLERTTTTAIELHRTVHVSPTQEKLVPARGYT